MTDTLRIIAMRTARQRYSLRVYSVDGLLRTKRYGSRASVLEGLCKYNRVCGSLEREYDRT